MATAHLTTTTSHLSHFLPRLFTSTLTPNKASPLLSQLTTPLSLLPPISLTLPPIITDIWNGILNAVPKKKTSYMKKRSRFMAGKALKDVTALNHCSACGHLKRAHLLCPYCVAEIKNMFNGRMKDVKPKPEDA